MVKAKILVLLAAAYFLLQPVAVPAEEGSVAKPDVRVLIDISGSMKQNDPHNLRVPALKMLIGLLPEDAKAGVWTFAEKVNMLVPHARVDEQWKNMARLQSSRINSVGLFTNIVGALEAAAFGSAGDVAGYHRSIILLTDGMVDIDRDPQVNLVERTRLLEQIVPAIMNTGIPVHSIALSKNADVAAMRQLSLSTGGIFAVAESADDLASIFLQAFDQSVPSEQVPLLDNQFLIDSSIEEFTLLAFRKQDSDATTLKSPAGTTFRVSDYPRHVKWFAGRGFDLITVRQPLEGEWILYADQAPGNRVTIISDLKLMVNKLPVNTYPGEELELAVHFQEEGKVIVNPDILKLLDIEIVVTFPDGSKKAKTISRGTARPGEARPGEALPGEAITAVALPADGVFRTPLKIFREKGKYNVLVSVDGKTFARERFQDVFLRDPVTVEVLEEIGVVRIKPISQLIDVSATSVLAKLKKPDAKSVIRPLSLEEGGYWDLDLNPFTQPGQYQLYLDIEGKTLSGQLFSLTLGPLTIQHPPSQLALNEPSEESAPLEPPQASELLAEQAPSVAAIDAESSSQQPDEEITAPEGESAPVADRDGRDSLLADPALVESILFGTLLLFGSLALFALGYWYYRKKLPVAQTSAERPGAGKEQVSAEPDSDSAREESPDLAEADGGEEITVLRETPEPSEDADELVDAVDEEASENGDAEDLDSAVVLDEEALDEEALDDDAAAAGEQDLDEFLEGISNDLEEKTKVAPNAASDSEKAESEGDPAESDGELEAQNNDGKFPGDRSLVFDEDIVDELVEQNRPTVDRSSEDDAVGSGSAANPSA